MSIARHIHSVLESASPIRRMFEEGAGLRQKYGADAVCDFSLGNPTLPPPREFREALTRLAAADFPGKYAYMANDGYPEVREKLAVCFSREWQTPLEADDLLMTCGAAGGLNVILKTLLNPGDEVIVQAPYFVEYMHYTANYAATLKVIPPGPELNLELAAIEEAITPRTAVLLLNSPNNPSGKIYPEQMIRELCRILEKKSRETGRTIYLLSDEPYRKLAYTTEPVPNILQHYPHSIIVSSASKELSIPGERIGWVIVNPRAEAARLIHAGACFATRTLGFVNAPALMQKVLAETCGISVDVSLYRRKRDRFCSALQEIGYKITPPEGTFYMFPPAPGGEDRKFCEILKKHLILTTPGLGFGCPGYFRIAFCVEDEVIERSLPGFRAALQKIGAEA